MVRNRQKIRFHMRNLLMESENVRNVFDNTNKNKLFYLKNKNLKFKLKNSELVYIKRTDFK